MRSKSTGQAFLKIRHLFARRKDICFSDQFVRRYSHTSERQVYYISFGCGEVERNEKIELKWEKDRGECRREKNLWRKCEDTDKRQVYKIRNVDYRIKFSF